MKRSLQEVVELVVFGLIALLIGTGLLWLLGWVLSLGGIVLKAIAGLLWLLLRFVVPVAIVAGLVYFLVKMLQDRGETPRAATTGASSSAPGASQGPAAPVAAPAVTASAGTGAEEASAAEADADEATDEPDEPDEDRSA